MACFSCLRLHCTVNPDGPWNLWTQRRQKWGGCKKHWQPVSLTRLLTQQYSSNPAHRKRIQVRSRPDDNATGSMASTSLHTDTAWERGPTGAVSYETKRGELIEDGEMNCRWCDGFVHVWYSASNAHINTNTAWGYVFLNRTNSCTTSNSLATVEPEY